MTEDYIDSGIIDPAELHALLQAGSVKLVDATFVLPNSPQTPFENYTRQRIGPAVFFDVEEICDHNTSLPHMLPSAAAFEAAVSRLGISNDDLVVVYAQTGMVMGPARVWWMFRVFGHDRVCVLNGGLPAWLAAGHPLETKPPPVAKPGRFKAIFRANLVKDLESVKEASGGGSAAILDARPAARYAGTAPEPRPGMRSGHIPGSHNLPALSLIDGGSGRIKPKSDIESLLQGIGINAQKPVIASCGSGVTACMIALALFHIGKKDVAVYDGSWSEWGHESADTPLSTS